MFVRYKTDGTRRVLHLSQPAFTTVIQNGEADTTIADGPLPAPIEQLRLASNLLALEVDPTLVPTPPTLSDVFDSVYMKWTKALGIACSNQTVAGIAWSTGGYTPAQIKARAIAIYQTL